MLGVREGGLCVWDSRSPEAGVDGVFSAWKKRLRATILGQCAEVCKIRTSDEWSSDRP